VALGASSQSGLTPPASAVGVSSNVRPRNKAMSPVPQLPEDRYAQFEWLRAVVQALRTHGGSVVSDELRDGLQRFITTNLPGHTFPAALDQEAFVVAALKLKDNDSSWNKALQSALVTAYDKAESGEHYEAAQALEAFATSCPWALYSEVAGNEARRISEQGQPQ
jgi:hypothetical protein